MITSIRGLGRVAALLALPAALAASWSLVPAGALAGQERTPPVVPAPDSTQAQAVGGVSPGGAFLRAVVLPGWGHASIGSHGRGGFYLAAQSGTAWMLLRIRSRIRDAERTRDLRERAARAGLAAAGVDPAEFETRLDDDEEVGRARGLVAARQQQFQDWAAVGIFTMLLSGVDAFVSAHLKDFPGPIQVETTALADGGVELGVRVPVAWGAH